MPFGVKNQPPTYQKAVTKAFREYIDVLMKIFLDDFTTFNDMSTHFFKLIKCFLKCREYGISLNPDKCAFMLCS
jgi:methionine synthase II (cobalamin-independent)